MNLNKHKEKNPHEFHELFKLSDEEHFPYKTINVRVLLELKGKVKVLFAWIKRWLICDSSFFNHILRIRKMFRKIQN